MDDPIEDELDAPEGTIPEEDVVEKEEEDLDGFQVDGEEEETL